MPPSRDESSIENEQVIDEQEYMTLLERVLALRQHAGKLSRPEEVDPWSFFAPYDRVKLRPLPHHTAGSPLYCRQIATHVLSEITWLRSSSSLISSRNSNRNVYLSSAFACYT